MKTSRESVVRGTDSAKAEGPAVDYGMEDVFRVVGTRRQVEMRVCRFGIEVCMYVRVCEINKSVKKGHRVRRRG